MTGVGWCWAVCVAGGRGAGDPVQLLQEHRADDDPVLLLVLHGLLGPVAIRANEPLISLNISLVSARSRTIATLMYSPSSQVILYSFYKNIVLTMILFYYSFFTGFSGTSLYQDFVYSG
jgi:hypothetical protein